MKVTTNIVEGRFTTEYTERATPDTEYTECVWNMGHGLEFCVFSVPSQTGSVCSVVKRYGGDLCLPRNTQNGFAVAEHTERKRLGFQCVPCAAEGGFSVFSGQERLARVDLPQNTQNGFADTEHTEDVGKVTA